MDAVVRQGGSQAQREIWIGLVELRSDEGNEVLAGAPGAYANTLANASSPAEYRELVVAAFAEEGLEVARIAGAEPLRVRQARHGVSADIFALADTARAGVVWDAFYLFAPA